MANKQAHHWQQKCCICYLL